MDLQYLRKVLKIFSDSDIEELEIEDETARIHMVRHHQGAFVAPVAMPQTGALPTPSSLVHVPVELTPAGEADDGLFQLRSPIVGTFYRAPSPDAQPFVTVGQTVQKGQTVCIIEAMKIWNEIEADITGKIVRILVENAQAVEYNQPLFLIEPA